MQSGFAQAVVSAEGLIVAVNDEMCAMFGRKAKELLGEPILCAEQARPEDEARLRRVLSGDVPLARFERRVASRYGGSVDLLVSLTGVRVDGRVDAAAVCVQDVTDLKSAQRRAESEEARWRSLSQNASEVALVTDAALTITYVSPAMTRLLGHDPQDVCGTSMLSLVHPEDVPRVTAAMRRLVAKKTRKSEIGYRVTNSSGHWRHVEQHVLNLLEDAHVEGLVVNLRDMTELEELRTARRRAVLEDRLTGLPNRALLMDRVEQAIERRHRTGGQYALLHIDLDKFRAINDTYGQGAGDTVLRRVSDTLCTLVGPSDTVGRYAGDEFVVLSSHRRRQRPQRGRPSRLACASGTGPGGRRRRDHDGQRLRMRRCRARSRQQCRGPDRGGRGGNRIREGLGPGPDVRP
jgi:PAS domain S-box-containing protein